MGRARHQQAAVDEQRPVASAVPAPQRAWPAYAPWALILLLFLAVRMQLLDVPLDRDEGGYGYAGQAILRGEVPYRDVIDQKPPGLFYVFALAALFPATAAGMHTFLLLWLLIGLTALAYCAWKLAGEKAALWTAGLFALLSTAPSVQGFTASAEPLALVPLAGSLAVAALALTREDRRRDLLMLASGVFAAIAFLIKPPLALPLAAIPLLFRGPRWKRDLAAWVIGGAIVGAVVAVAVTAAGLWKEFWYWNSTHTSLYRQKSWDGWTDRLSVLVKLLLPDLLVPLILAITGCVSAFRKSHRYALFLTAFLALSAVSCIQAGYLYPHYFAQLVGAAALAGGIGAVALVESIALVPTSRRIAAAVLALIVLAVPVTSRPWYWINPHPILVSMRMLGPQAFEASPLIAEVLRGKTKPGDSIWIFGNEPQILFMTQRRSATPFLFMYPMIGPFPRHRQFQEQTWTSVQAANPAFIVVVREPSLMQRWAGTDTFIDGRLESVKPRYVVDSCLALDARDGLALHTQLDVKRQACPGHPVIEIWRRRS